MKRYISIFGFYADNPKKYKLFLVFVFCTVIILHSGLRDVQFLPEQNDTIRFLYSYERISQVSLSKLIQSFSFYTVDYGERDLGYPIFVKFSQFICDDFTFFMFLTAVVFLVPFSMLIYRYVNSYNGIILSFIIFIALYNNIVNSFMRQAVALGIILYAVKYISNHNWIKYFLLLAIAFVIHSSAILAIPLYFLNKFAKSRKWLILSLLVSPILMLYTPIIINYLATGSVYENYGDEEMRSPINYIIYLLGAAILTYSTYPSIIKIQDSMVLIAGVIGSTLLIPLVWMGGTAIRISYYYSIFIIPLLPLTLDNVNISKNTRNLIYFVLIIFFFILSFK